MSFDILIKKIIVRFKNIIFNLKLLMNAKKRFIYRMNNSDRFYLSDDEISKSIYVYDNFENINRLFWGSLIKPGMNVIDIGANWGVYSTAARRLVGENGMLMSFEPNKVEFEKLKENLKLNKFNQKNITLINSAVGDEEGTAEFFIPPNYKGAYGSMGRPKINEDCKVVKVPVVTMDDVLKKHGVSKVDVIKIDVEGAEIKVLHGMKKTLDAQSPVILMEVSDKRTEVFGYKAKELCVFLADMGYSLYLPVLESGKIGLKTYEPSDHIKYVDIVAKKDK